MSLRRLEEVFEALDQWRSGAVELEDERPGVVRVWRRPILKMR